MPITRSSAKYRCVLFSDQCLKKKKVFLNLFLTCFSHLLVVFGGLQGLEASVDNDQNLDVTDPSVLFDFYLNTCPNQGSRTIRTEVSVL